MQVGWVSLHTASQEIVVTIAVMQLGDASKQVKCKQVGSGSKVEVAGFAIVETPLRASAFNPSGSQCSRKTSSMRPRATQDLQL